MLLLDELFSGRRSQRKVAEFMLRNGICIKNGRLFFGSVELSDVKVARALGVDRRVIKSTVGTITQDRKLKDLYSKLGSTVLLKDVASAFGFGAIEIIPKNASAKGIVANVAKAISDEGISIRQLTTDDPMFSDAEMSVVTEKPIPRALIDKLLKIKGVKKVVVVN
ncbi:MAG: amino acid-binding protein [Candidatus Altiarchaeales archaeon]|nr:amino acid-binding protein [Candidatus Altiarchaeales archaeon]